MSQEAKLVKSSKCKSQTRESWTFTIVNDMWVSWLYLLQEAGVQSFKRTDIADSIVQ